MLKRAEDNPKEIHLTISTLDELIKGSLINEIIRLQSWAFTY